MSGKTSKIWDHFEKKKDDPKKVTCKLCKKNFAYHSSTMNMMYHLKHVSSLATCPWRPERLKAEINTFYYCYMR